ncbi:DNA N-6-adenine-methyltransferase, partial [Escherichia coli]|uniref:DNA N-6-adenine-methyltransferase n=6 Tax=Escherichia coli TaxID=562 RepID=UPI0023797943
KTCIFSHPVYLFLREFSLQDSRGGSVGWFSKALESVDEVRIITDGRINFIEPSTGLEKKGNSKGSMLLIWRPFISPRRMFTIVSKAALMAIGQGVRRAT